MYSLTINGKEVLSGVDLKTVLRVQEELSKRDAFRIGSYTFSTKENKNIKIRRLR